jgi:SPW repeat
LASGVTAAAWTAWLSAIAIGILAVATLTTFAGWKEWISLTLGLWVLISPWVIGAANQPVATSVLFVTGLAVAVIAVDNRSISAFNRSAGS